MTYRIRFDAYDGDTVTGVGIYEGPEFPPEDRMEPDDVYYIKIESFSRKGEAPEGRGPVVGQVYGVFGPEVVSWEPTVVPSADQPGLLEVGG